jgi:hypothetical protein
VRPAPKITPKIIVALVEQARDIAAEEAAPRSPSRLGMAIVLASLTLIGWGVIKTTWAQDAPKPTLPAITQTPASREISLPAVKSSQPATDGLGALPEEPSTSFPDAKPIELSGKRDASTPSKAPAPEATLAVSRPVADANDDPEKNVQSFVEQNRKVAEGQLKGLREEAEKLRARLKKVEGGIKRWESLLAALEKSEAIASPKGLTLTDPRARTLNSDALESAPIEKAPEGSREIKSDLPPPVELDPAPAPR